MKQLTYVLLAAILSGSICTPKPEKTDITSEKALESNGVPAESTAPEGERAGSGFW